MKKLAKILSFASIAIVLAAAFQNCNSNGISAANSAGQVLTQEQGGGGIDGMRFQSYGACSSKTGAPADIITLSSSTQTAAFTTQDCQVLSNPVPVDMSELSFARTDSSILTYNGRVFDELVAASEQQRITVTFCHSDEIETFVWAYRIAPGAQIFGTVNTLYANTSGPLNMQGATPNTKNFASEPGQNSSFALAATTTGSISYSLNGGPVVSASKIFCTLPSALISGAF